MQDPCKNPCRGRTLMAEYACERVRRLRDIAPLGSVDVQAQETEAEATGAPLALFQQLHALGVVLRPYPDGTLRYKAPKGTMTPALLDALHQHTAELHGLVEAFEERA